WRLVNPIWRGEDRNLCFFSVLPRCASHVLFSYRVEPTMSMPFLPRSATCRRVTPAWGGNRRHPRLAWFLAVRFSLAVGLFAVIFFFLGPLSRQNHCPPAPLANQEACSTISVIGTSAPSHVTSAWPGRTLATQTPIAQSGIRAADKLSGEENVADLRLVGVQGRTDHDEGITREKLERLEATLAQWCRTAPAEVEGRLLAEAQAGRLQGLDLLTAAMLAGGSSPQKVRSLLDRFKGQLRRIEARVDPQAAPLVRLRQAFRGLHAEILHGGYDIAASNPGEAIQTGRFNCVSASLLFKLIAEFLGFEVQVIQTPTHAYCGVKCENVWVPVECTSPHSLDGKVNQTRPEDGLRGKQGEEWTDQRWLGRPMVSRSQQQDWRTWGEGGRDVSDTQLLGTIYYNRGVAALLDRQFETAVVTNLRAIQLDPESHSARDNLLASLNNWAIALAERGAYGEAAARLHLALEIRSDSGPIQANLYRVYREWQNAWRRHGGDAESARNIRESIRSLPSDGRCAELRGKVEALFRK
ncbi:MAG: tetratricopeptide repeat protein, partial [Thermogutta sp.]